LIIVQRHYFILKQTVDYLKNELNLATATRIRSTTTVE
jgi:hypothetical protein